MSQLSGSWSAEVDTTRLAEAIAQRCAVLLLGMLRASGQDLEIPVPGSDVYHREPEGSADPGAGPVRGRVQDNLDQDEEP